MAHPQNSHRGLLSKSAIKAGSTGVFLIGYSSNTAALTANSTGVKVANSLALNSGSNFISQNSTGAASFPAGVMPSGKSTAQMTGNSTGVVFAGDLTIGDFVLSANTTGLTIGTAQISTA